jgi:type IV secretory pathway VirB4 component
MPPNNQAPSAPPAAPIGSGPAAAPQAATPLARKNPNSTQNTLQLSEVRDDMVIMADGTFRAVIACQSINFDLMSNGEREGVEFSYQNFLNSLNFPVQILIKSQRVDIGPYIDKLVAIRRDQDNMLLNVLMDDYINFIDVLSQEANIMKKTFYIAVPYYPLGDVTSLIEQGKGFFGKLLARPKNTVTKIDTASYEKAKTEIKNRVDAVTSGLYQLGVQSIQLGTKELGELYYNSYNPDTAVREPLVNFDNITATFIKKAPAAPTQPGLTQ